MTHSFVADPFAEARTDLRAPSETVPPRIIEVGETAAGITVPEGRGVRFFSSARAFDSLDGTLFRDAEQAARAARERSRALGRRRTAA